ncbi:THUMP-like domain-containing protein [Actinokineospora sp. HUAS TT18]|uniref:THUMP-like domain-containing protein n=1 Tax=Actinokineospora sp. HUAS TT18 TaxID=3447451 RepID=UPI003F528DA5
MGYGFTLGDVAFLRSPDGVAAAAEIDRLPLTSAGYLADVAKARTLAGDRAAALLETVLLRRKAASKVDDPVRWLFTDAALQQATPTPVARHRARRLAGRTAHDVTCSVGVDLAAVAEVADRAIGSDLDPVRLAMARGNVPGVALVRADALTPVTRSTAVLADPGRRDSAGRRRWRPEDFAPPLNALADTYRGRDLAVKCAPGIDFADVPWADEVEVVSLDGAVREACLWTGGLATEAKRRATVLRSDGTEWTVTDDQDDTCPVLPVGEWIIDPDGAVVRAGLVRHYAAAHGLGQLDERIAYLTGPEPPPGVRAFRVLEHGKYTEKALKATLAKRGIGRLEILVRGLEVDPNALRPRLKLKGDGDASVVLTRIGRAPVAIVCEAVSSADRG